MKVAYLLVLFWVGFLLANAQERMLCEENGTYSGIRCIVVYEQGRRYTLVGVEVSHQVFGEGIIDSILRYDIPEGLSVMRAIDGVLGELDRLLVEVEADLRESFDIDESKGEYLDLYLQVKPMRILGTAASYRVDVIMEGKFHVEPTFMFPAIEFKLDGKHLAEVRIITVVDSQLYVFNLVYSPCEKQIKQAEQLVREFISDFKVKE